MSVIPPDQLVVEVDHPDGHTWQVDPLDDAQYLPNINDKPEVRIPVPRSQERWLDPDWESVQPEMRVWQGGKRLPIDEFRRPEVTPEWIVLVGEGGKELDQSVAIEVNQEEAYVVGRDGVQNNSPYTTNFDDPATSSEEKLFVSAQSESELQSALLNPIDSEDPYQLANGGIEPLQASFTQEAESGTSSGTLAASDGSYSDGAAEGFNDGGYIEWTFSLPYDLPEDAFRIWYRNEATDNTDVPSVTWYLDGAEVGSTNSLTSLGWDEVYDTIGTTSSALSSGTHTVRAEGATGSFSNTRIFDVVAPLDGRYSWTFDNDNGGNGGYLDGPELYPPVAVVFDDYATVFNLSAGRVDSTFTATDDGQQVSLSNDRGQSYTTATNQADFSTTFASAGATIRFRATVGRTGSRTTATPQTGFEPQRLDGFDLYGTVEDSPVVTNRKFDTSLLSLLQTLAEFSNSIFELVWDSDAGTIRVEWTRPGQRSSMSTGSVTDYSLSKDLRVYKKVTVKGSFRTRSGEQITADHGTAVSLDQDDLVTSRESVRDPDTGTEYEDRVDYTVDYRNGTITTLSAGEITDGQSLVVDYQYEPRGSYAADDYDASTDLALPPQKINSVTTDREAEQAALTIQQDIDSPVTEATATVSRLEAGRSLIDDLTLDALPTDKGFEVRELDRTPEDIVLQLGSRRQLSEIVSDINQRLGATQERA